MSPAFKDTFKAPDLRKKILFTIGMLAIYRLGCYIPTPGINGKALSQFFASMPGNLLSIANFFAGGALGSATIFALGIMPYISISIVLELLAGIFPYFERILRSGVEGRRKFTQWTRIGTVLLCIVQGFMVSIWLENPSHFGNIVMVSHPGWKFIAITIITLTAGTSFLMWLGEQITEKGIGNGISLIIAGGIISQIPAAIQQMTMLTSEGLLSPVLIVFLIILIFFVVAAAIALSQAERRVPIQYAKRVVGRKVYGGQSTYLPIKINQGGVLPLIFAIAFVTFPSIMLQFSNKPVFRNLAMILSPASGPGMILYGLLIVGFCYFYAAIIFNPEHIAEDLKNYGGFIAGIRPGKTTSEYLEKILVRLTLPGSLMLVGIAILPYILMHIFKIQSYLIVSMFGGIGLLIVVEVILETMNQVEANLVMRQYEGFLRKVHR
ncbi:MAG: preprotein translocase subunit SecY [Candidatus Omnitrophica bacterium]|jgi:preprotein translocase subunit SecY|nr:preprotein translocase subunit SecY [Candidatus Omnitrophota bacterium]